MLVFPFTSLFIYSATLDRICPKKLEMKPLNQTKVSAVLPELQICWDVGRGVRVVEVL